jgi:hypothetical protein
MKRPKKATISIIQAVYNRTRLTCPHCHNVMEGQIDDYVMRLACWHCHQPIDIRWPIPAVQSALDKPNTM